MTKVTKEFCCHGAEEKSPQQSAQLTILRWTFLQTFPRQCMRFMKI